MFDYPETFLFNSDDNLFNSNYNICFIAMMICFIAMITRDDYNMYGCGQSFILV